MTTKISIGGTFVCDALQFDIQEGRQTFINAGTLRSPHARIPGLREPDRFELHAPLSAMALADLPDGVEAEQDGRRYELQVVNSTTTGAGHFLSGYAKAVENG